MSGYSFHPLNHLCWPFFHSLSPSLIQSIEECTMQLVYLSRVFEVYERSSSPTPPTSYSKYHHRFLVFFRYQISSKRCKEGTFRHIGPIPYLETGQVDFGLFVYSTTYVHHDAILLKLFPTFLAFCYRMLMFPGLSLLS